MSVVCTVNGCPWKITCRAIGASYVVKVHTFINHRNHSIDDVVANESLVRSTRADMVIDDVIRSTPKYQPQLICEYFVREHRMRLSYCQAWKIKEKAKERIYGFPRNFLLWMCYRVVQMNPGLIVDLTYSSNDHFEQLFIAHEVSIQGFLLGCRPFIAIDSSHLSGPYVVPYFQQQHTMRMTTCSH